MKVLLISALVFVLAQSSLGKPSLKQQWQSFKTTHNKQYNDPDEEHYRLTVFTSNLYTIRKHNREYAEGKHTWYMGLNRLTDLTHEEFMKLNQLKVRELPQRKSTYKMKAKAIAAEVDWREEGYVTDVKDQGQCGSCWAFGAIASLEAANFESHGKLIALSEQQLVDCDTVNGGCNGGWYDTAWDYIKEAGGVNSMISYPYEARDGICRFDINGVIAHVTGCYGGPNHVCEAGGRDGNEDNLVAALNDHPQAVAVDASYFQFYSGGIFTNTLCSRNALNHAVFAVGYGSDGLMDYYIVKNSWGAAWGEAGYIRMQRGINKDGGLCGIADYPGYAVDTHMG